MVRIAALYAHPFVAGLASAVANPVVYLSSSIALYRRASNVTGVLPTDNNTDGIPFDSPSCRANSSCAPFFAANCSTNDVACACTQPLVQAFTHCMECGISNSNDTSVSIGAATISIEAYVVACAQNGQNINNITFEGTLININGARHVGISLGIISVVISAVALLL